MRGSKAVLLFLAPLLAQGQESQVVRPVMYTAAQEAAKADRLFRELNADALEIDSHATLLVQLAKSPDTQRAQFDLECIDIAPAQVMLEAHMWSLDEMRASLSDAQRRILDQTKRAAAVISARTNGLLKLIGKRGSRLNIARLGSDAQTLAEYAESVSHVSASA